MTDKLIPDYRRRTKLQQPNYTRSRAAYRSPLNSEIMNLEAEQLRFDLTKLRVQTDLLKTTLDKQLDLTTADAINKVKPSHPSYFTISTVGNYLSAPDAPELGITGDLTVVVRVKATDWTPSDTWHGIVGKASANGWWLGLFTDARLYYTYYIAGVQQPARPAPINTFADGSWQWIAFTHDVDDGAGNNVIRYFLSPDSFTWTLWGTASVAGGTVSRSTTTTSLYLGAQTNTTFPWGGSISYISIRDGIGPGGTVGGNEVFRFDANANITNTNATTLTATTGQTITVNKLGSTPTTLTNNSYELLSTTETIAAKVDLIREQVRRLEIAKGINS
jgi:hypothetical protein